MSVEAALTLILVTLMIAWVSIMIVSARRDLETSRINLDNARKYAVLMRVWAEKHDLDIGGDAS